MADRESWGHALERAALLHILKTPGYRLVAENYFSRVGEIDLIVEFLPSMRGRRIELVFVEVKGRRGWRNGLESVDWAKRRRLELTANRFLMTYRGQARFMRFDVMVWELGKWVWVRDAWRGEDSRPY